MPGRTSGAVRCGSQSLSSLPHQGLSFFGGHLPELLPERERRRFAAADYTRYSAQSFGRRVRPNSSAASPVLRGRAPGTAGVSHALDSLARVAWRCGGFSRIAAGRSIAAQHCRHRALARLAPGCGPSVCVVRRFRHRAPLRPERAIVRGMTESRSLGIPSGRTHTFAARGDHAACS